MHDVRDAVLADRPLDLFEVRDVAVDERQLIDLLGRHDELEPSSVRAEVVQDDRNVLAHELCARPGADAPERTGDQEALIAHRPLSLLDRFVEGVVSRQRAIVDRT